MNPQAKHADEAAWPALPLKEWEPTRATLHMWTQMAGKVKLALCPNENHWWNVTLHVNSRGLTTQAIPYGNRVFEMQFDFQRHVLDMHCSDGRRAEIALAPRPVCDFYREFTEQLASLDVRARIRPMPCEVADPIHFDEDRVHASYDREYASRFWRVLLSATSVLEEFRARFLGKCSPVHFFWGSFDLAVTRFSGRRAPERPGADRVTREAYSHEVISVGFWPGGGDIQGAAFYSYAAPTPEGFGESVVRPKAAFYHKQLGEFLLMYDQLRAAKDPAAALLEFLESTYAAAARLAHWDRAALESEGTT